MFGNGLEIVFVKCSYNHVADYLPAPFDVFEEYWQCFGYLTLHSKHLSWSPPFFTFPNKPRDLQMLAYG